MKTNDYVYTKAGTDITIRWKKLYNYIPASEQPNIKKKWADIKAICSKGVEDLQKEAPVMPAQVFKWKAK
jgi:hypothetical protein